MIGRLTNVGHYDIISSMNRALTTELAKLDADERLRLAYDLLDSVANDTAVAPISDEHRRELRRRLAEYRANPEEPVVTLADIRRELGMT